MTHKFCLLILIYIHACHQGPWLRKGIGDHVGHGHLFHLFYFHPHTIIVLRDNL
jgi:hypothetical protein